MDGMLKPDGRTQRRAACALFVLMSSLAICATSAWAQSVAMVTDVAGKTTVQGGAKAGDITILAEIGPDTRLQLDGGARLVVIYLQTGNEYAFTGPAQIQFNASEPPVVSGAQPHKRTSLLGRSSGDVTIKPMAVTQGAMVMRSAVSAVRIKLLNPVGTRTLETAPEFRWRAVAPGMRYQFELTDDTGRPLYEIQVEGVALNLPPAIRLREGVTYTWAVSAHGADGRRYVNSGDFSIAPAELRARVEAMRPASGAPVSERVAFAAWLAQSELKDEARKYWILLAAERPADPRLRALAAQ